MIKKLREEVIVPLAIIIALLVAFVPYIAETRAIRNELRPDRYPLIETDFAPDLRVYLSRMYEGMDGKWLVWEKYTSEAHQPTILHIIYLLMGKVSGLFGILPTQALPVWRLVSSVFMMIGGYYFILQVFSNKKLRIVAFLMFVFSGNFPILARGGIPVFGLEFSSFLGWNTFFDPARRIIFLPHYNLGAGLLAFSLAFLWKAIRTKKTFDFAKAGIVGFFAGLVLPQNGLIMLVLSSILIIFTLQKKSFLSWPFWIPMMACIGLLKFSMTYFPWDVQSLADLTKRGMALGFYKEAWLAIGPTAVIGAAAIPFAIAAKRKEAIIPVVWLLSAIIWIIAFTLLPLSNATRVFQMDFHLLFAALSTILLDELWRRKGYISVLANLVLVAVFLIAFLSWAVSISAQTLFTKAKISADYPLIPQLPYVVYPSREAMEAIFWVRDNTSHDKVVLAAETLGSMIPAYAGNTVFLGHGNQTVFFDEKKLLINLFFSGQMSQKEASAFLQKYRIDYVVSGPEELAMGDIASLKYPFLRLVFANDMVSVWEVIGN